MTTSGAGLARRLALSKVVKRRSRLISPHPSMRSMPRWWMRFFIALLMKTVISAKDIDELLRRGGDVQTLPANAILTPSARDRLRDLETPARYNSTAALKPAASAKPVTSKSPKAELDAFFNSPE